MSGELEIELRACADERRRALDVRGAQVVSLFDPLYPSILREIPDPPLVLFYRGELCHLLNRQVAIVGSRRCSALARTLSCDIAEVLVQSDICVVSGLAVGVDSAAHRGALAAQGKTQVKTGQQPPGSARSAKSAPTLAVLGSGIESIYPAVNRKLAERIVQTGGVLLTEYADGHSAAAHHFPERNRIISGLSEAVVVIEAGDRSGSLITARMALEQGRDVLAVPGAVDNPRYVGSHRLIKDGAGLVCSAGDVLANLNLPPLEADNAVELTREQQALFSLLDQPVSVDELELLLGWPVARILGTVAALQSCDLVKVDGSGYVVARGSQA